MGGPGPGCHVAELHLREREREPATVPEIGCRLNQNFSFLDDVVHFNCARRAHSFIINFFCCISCDAQSDREKFRSAIESFNYFSFIIKKKAKRLAGQDIPSKKKGAMRARACWVT